MAFCRYTPHGLRLIDYHPYDGRLIRYFREINPTNIERIESLRREGHDPFLIFMGDTQRSYNETEDFVKYVNQLDSIDFHYPWRRLYGVRLKEGIRSGTMISCPN